MNVTMLDTICEQITYPGRSRIWIERGEDDLGLWVEVCHWRMDQVTGASDIGYGGKRRISTAASTSRVVRTIFGAFLALEEHEAREAFRYRGAQVFGPHIDVDALVEVADRVDYEAPVGSE